MQDWTACDEHSAVQEFRLLTLSIPGLKERADAPYSYAFVLSLVSCLWRVQEFH
jgi:hypothetical protein